MLTMNSLDQPKVGEGTATTEDNIDVSTVLWENQQMLWDSLDPSCKNRNIFKQWAFNMLMMQY